MVQSSVDYELLPTGAETQTRRLKDLTTPATRLGLKKREIYLFSLSVFVNALALGWILWDLRSDDLFVRWRGDQATFSPLQHVISYHNYTMPSLTSRTSYHAPPDDALDARWRELYIELVSVIPDYQAAQLANKTFQYPPPEKDRNLSQVDAFHIMHCLNTIRKFVWPERYPIVQETRFAQVGKFEVDHIDHCLNAVRQSLMCSADITPLVWQRDEGTHVSQIHFNTVHTCRNWSAVQKWASDHSIYSVPGVNPDPAAGVGNPLK